ncbi:hypothetical protein TrCOL_g663 [Triparma columacea]|jgi:hypothetical protein|uniref:CW-type domain-containing protein n=1 Tax=Triparma columacea TaxID=722753 RepID=A0A9W7LDN8_9STRA|nr:hypothetical protein TrCOL_g663 [Triparma columacea]
MSFGFHPDPLPGSGTKIAINCPADPPHPAGWYSALIVEHLSNGSTKIEWDGGDEDVLHGPVEWRLLGEEPDQKGQNNPKDARLRPHLGHVVRRLMCGDGAEQRGSSLNTRRSRKLAHELEWVQCSSSSCGKWRALPAFLNGGQLLKSCNNTFFCVLNYWDESLASCAAPQETRLIEAGEENGRVLEQRVKAGQVGQPGLLGTAQPYEGYGGTATEYRRIGRRAGRRDDYEEEFEYGYRPSNKRRR